MTKKFPKRKSLRLQDYDYTQSGAYFVTICTHQRYLWFGDVFEAEMCLSGEGKIAEERWLALPKHHPNVDLDMYVVMPNHVHGIVVITGDAGIAPTKEGQQSPKKRTLVAGSLGSIIGSYKSGVTRRIRQSFSLDDTLWQRGYHERIIRNEAHLNRLRNYILYNPAKWHEDEFYHETS